MLYADFEFYYMTEKIALLWLAESRFIYSLQCNANKRPHNNIFCQILNFFSIYVSFEISSN